MKITVIGTGYVGLSNAILLAQHNEVIAFDIDHKKITMLNNKQSPIIDKEIDFFLKKKKLNFKATSNKNIAYNNANYIIIAIPTNYNKKTKTFDTSTIITIIKDINHINDNTLIIIKSTLPIGFIKKLKQETGYDNIIFIPEFLREGKALYDNLYPSRIIIGEKSKRAKIFADLLLKGALKKKITVLFTNETEAEAIKLFTNSYLAMRIAFFNELDTFSLKKKLNVKDIIHGVSLDTRIGNYYNNPSFGFGGYCLPKDTKQLNSHFNEIPNKLIKSIIQSNEIRKNNIAELIIKKKPKTVGIYRLIMKNSSDNFRNSAVYNIIKQIKKHEIKILVYEPLLKSTKNIKFKIIKNLTEFKNQSDIILANRLHSELNNMKKKVFTRDLFGDN